MRTRLLPFAVAFVLGGVLLACLPAPAAAGLHLCNKTSETIHASIGYDSGDSITTEGWWNIDPGNCATPLGGELGTWTNYYVYAYSSSETWADENNNSNHDFCVDPTNAFTLYNAHESCGYQWHYFRYIDTSTNCNDDFACPNYSDFTYSLTP